MDILKRTRPIILSHITYDGTIRSSAQLGDDDLTWYVDYSGQLHNDGGPNLTFAEYKQKVEPAAMLISWEELATMDRNYLASRLTEPLEITEDHYHEKLEVLPPCRWDSYSGIEMFHISERIQGDLVNWYAKADGKYWEWVGFASTPADELVQTFIKAVEKG